MLTNRTFKDMHYDIISVILALKLVDLVVIMMMMMIMLLMMMMMMMMIMMTNKNIL